MKTKIIFYLSVLTLSLCWSQISHAQAFVIKPGEKKYISINPESELRIKGGRYISWSDKGNKLLVTGVSPGIARVSQSGRVLAIFNVLPSTGHNAFTEAQLAIKKMIGPKVYLEKNKIFVTGVFHRISDWKILNQIFSKYNTNYQFVGQFADDKIVKLHNQIKKMTNDHFHLEPKLESTSPLVISRIKKSNFEQFDRKFKKLGFKIIDKTSNRSAYQIKYHLHFYEITENLIDNWGVRFDGGLSAQILTGFQNLSQLNAFMDQSINNGTVKLVSKNTLICTPNAKCSFVDGGELPIKTSGLGSSGVTWKPYGVIFKFNSKIEKEKKVRYKINYQVSFPDTSLSTDGIPGIKIKKLETSVLSKNNQPVLLTNLELEKTSNSVKGLSPFDKIPLLNLILNNSSKGSTKTKLALFVTPSIQE